MPKSIPVFIDDIKTHEGFDFSRCTYFYIESVDEIIDWNVYADRKIPMIPTKLEGVIYKPLGRTQYFKSTRFVAELFDYIEDFENIIVEINDLWIPNSCLSVNKNIRDVYRLSAQYFNVALQFRDNGYSKIYLDELLSYSKGDIRFSKLETDVFKDWAKEQIRETQELFARNSDMKLKLKN